jgi:hypothetical protein
MAETLISLQMINCPDIGHDVEASDAFESTRRSKAFSAISPERQSPLTSRMPQFKEAIMVVKVKMVSVKECEWWRW